MGIIQRFSKTNTINFKLQANNSDIIPIINSNKTNIPVGTTLITNNIVIKQLRIYSNIQSLEQVPLPFFDITDSDTIKLGKLLDLEWKSQRKEVNICLRIKNGQWNKISSLSLVSNEGYPFKIHDVFNSLSVDNLSIDKDAMIGINVSDAGYGLLSPLDSVTVFGEYDEEYILYCQNLDGNNGNNGNNNAPSLNSLVWDNQLSESQWQQISDSQWLSL